MISYRFVLCSQTSKKTDSSLSVPPTPVSESLSAANKNDHAAIDAAILEPQQFWKIGGNEVPGICMNMSGQRLLGERQITLLQI